MLFLQILFIALLVLIAYQDFKYQGITWVIFPIGFLLAFVIATQKVLLTTIFVNIAVTSLFLIFQLGVIFIYTRLKNKNTINIFKYSLGIGDFLFWIMILPLFSLVNFIFFYIQSLLFSIIIFFTFKKALKYKTRKVPLAGLQAVFLVVLLIFQIFIKFNLLNDNLILSFFNF